MNITLIDESNYLSKPRKELIVNILNFAGKSSELQLSDNTEMSVTIVNNQQIQEINKEYRGKDMPTDVISFAIEDNGDEELMFDLSEFDIPRDIGDIVVSFPKVDEQAKEYNHSFERELGFLVVHGFLHLNGYDHMTAEEEKVMFDLQRKILDEYGLER
ncbi:rRNA maturation RNase YbeY [Vagococcus vulneris]|uniref:Endoribonuclease YbeY n=1 Tax=Vagococcus vulneris TaxID=1977869 RepID=A0A430A235_9ENTE|nr:rRNA maturation RNase YbeY [Vagococcus vulneris]RSU00485.1 rRNA maturation RNase YbeY [Vagococcus vulneris]